MKYLAIAWGNDLRLLLQRLLTLVSPEDTRHLHFLPSLLGAGGVANSRSLVDRVGASLGLYSSYRGGRGGHPLTVPQYTKDHLNSIIFLPPDWPGNDTTQMILHILAHRQRVSSSPVRADQI